jgi:2-dehydro-3-deoxyphosphogluconate aldolase / (4S)-4-hydroxy-2-oxoglutarate aldolase
MMDTMARINVTGLVPVVVLDDSANAVDTAKALLQGGVDIMEITMRTAAGMESIRRVSEECPEMLVGAGTVLSLEQCKKAIDFGAKFIVSPGYDEEVVDFCKEAGIPICPGCVTPTEIMKAIKNGIKVIKFFPSDVYGGLKAMKALSGPFSGVKFIPTGGVDLNNLKDYNSPIIHAIGGGWLCSRDLINKGEYHKVTEVCYKSVDILLGLKDREGNTVALEELMKVGGEVTTINLEKTSSQLTRRGFELNSSGEELQFKREGITICLKEI